jgi:hypothetical protein
MLNVTFFYYYIYTGCSTRYRTRHFFNNSNTNKDIVTKFEQEYVLFFHISYTMRQVCFKFRCNIFISGKIIKEMPSSVASGTPCRRYQITIFVCILEISKGIEILTTNPSCQ